MKNRAKCKLCGDIIESFHSNDFVTCKCGEICVSEGNSMKCSAMHWQNFLRVDDEGNEIIPIIKDITEDISLVPEKAHKPDKKELFKLLDDMRENIENLPPNAMSAPITHYDLCSLLLLLSSIFRAED
ncbi:MAG TPA: hypothetical protein VFG24_00095 [Nitrosopumilaceae archaeon]|nr:hypothetical protein [Nitrosopumilaceae archaeon]